MAALAWWSAAYAAELLSVSLAVQLAWIKVEYVGILAAPLAREHELESLTDGIAVHDSQDRLVDASAAFLRPVDRSAAVLVGQTASTASPAAAR